MTLFSCGVLELCHSSVPSNNTATYYNLYYNTAGGYHIHETVEFKALLNEVQRYAVRGRVFTPMSAPGMVILGTVIFTSFFYLINVVPLIFVSFCCNIYNLDIHLVP